MFETGVGIRNPLFFVGVVENGLDPRHENRVQVRAFGIHGTIDQIPTEDLPWAICVAGNYHMNSLPQENHWVLGMFLDGRDAQQPIIIGTIPTFMSSIVNPQVDGYGVLPQTAEQQVINGGNPESVGTPPMHKLACGEYPEETCVLEQEVDRVLDVIVASNPNAPDKTFAGWSEPPTAYAARYGFNRVYDSPDGKTTIELDSTPGAERLMIWHKGSYVQVDTNGTRTDKSYGDHYEVKDHNNMIYVGGRSSVTIMGDSHVYVDGNKIEQIRGDLVQIVHGNHYIGVGGQMNLNAGEEVQMRGAQLRLESNVAGINLKAAKGLFAETGESMHFKSGIAIFQEATNSFNMKAGDNIFIQCDTKLNLKAENVAIEAEEIADVKGETVRVGGGTNVDIDAGTVNIDENISMANLAAVSPSGASEATEADPSKSTELPEPPPKSTSTARSRNRANVSTAGAASVDDTTESGSTSRDDELNASTQTGEIPPYIGASSPPGSSLTVAQENAVWEKLEAQERERRLAAGLPAQFSEQERRALKAILPPEGGDYAATLSTVLNRSYHSRAPIHYIVFADRQFSPATSYLTGYTDKIAGIDETGFKKFTGAYNSNATTSFEDAVNRYQSVPRYDEINYFVGIGLPVEYGTLVYEAGNKYSVGEPGNFARNGAQNYDRFIKYLNQNNIS